MTAMVFRLKQKKKVSQTSFRYNVFPKIFFLVVLRWRSSKNWFHMADLENLSLILKILHFS
jgi:hypothetical protein